MTRDELQKAIRNAGRTKKERAEFVRAEAARRGCHWVIGGPEEWSKDEIDNVVIAIAQGTWSP